MDFALGHWIFYQSLLNYLKTNSSLPYIVYIPQFPLPWKGVLVSDPGWAGLRHVMKECISSSVTLSILSSWRGTSARNAIIGVKESAFTKQDSWSLCRPLSLM